MTRGIGLSFYVFLLKVALKVMSSSAWVTLSDTWEIGTVRAIMALLVNVLCVAGSWAVAYGCWKTGALEAARSARTRLPALVSLGGIGDVIDVVPLLFSTRLGVVLRTRLVIQVVLVVLLSVAGILSGPIARFTTQPGLEIRQANVSGWLPTTTVLAVPGMVVQWTTTMERLDSAGFPHDQLLDFFPDVGTDWKYRASEWNSSWSASCQWTDQTVIQLNATGNSTDDILDQFPTFRGVFPPEYFTPAYNRSLHWSCRYTRGKVYDAQLFLLFQSFHPGASYTRDNSTGHYRNDMPFNLSIAALNLHNAPAAHDSYVDDSAQILTPGPVEKASYTIATCALKRTDDSTEVAANSNIAFPWAPFITSSVTRGLIDFYKPKLMEQSHAGGGVPLPSGRDLFRFYQTYLVRKDTAFKHVVWRKLSVDTPTVEVVVAVLVVFLMYTVFLCAGVFWLVVVWRLPGHILIPRSKIEWMIQGVKEAGRQEADPSFLDNSRSRSEDLIGAFYGQTSGGQLGITSRTIRKPGEGVRREVQA